MLDKSVLTVRFMPITPEIANLVERLNRELNETQQDAIIGLNLVRKKLSRSGFSDNEILTQFFGALNGILFFVEIHRGRIERLIERISLEDIPDELMQETAEDLGTILGQVLEVRINANRLKKRLES